MNDQYSLELKKVSAKKISDFIFEQLEEAIILKELLPEWQLPTEHELAKRFDASRMAVREALARLEKQDLIIKKVGAKGGTFVQPVTLNTHLRSPEDIRLKWPALSEVFEYRELIEPEAAFLAAKRLKPEEIEQLEELIIKGEDPDISRESFRALDVRFHLLIAKGSGNRYIEQAVRKIRTEINPTLDLIPYDDYTKKSNLHMHKQLLTALKAQNEHLARKLMDEHIKRSLSRIYEKLWGSGNGETGKEE